VEENLGKYQCGFQKGRSTIEQLSVIGQIKEKKYEYRQNIWQLFVDFKKAYDSIHQKSLYNIMDEVGIPKKLINLIKMCMENTQYQIRVDNTLSKAFEVNTGLKQGDALSPMLFNLSLKKTIREMQKETTGITIGERRIQVLGFADDLKILESSLNDTKRAAQVLEQAAGKVGLKINREKRR
jgi:sorting nexin-29